MCCSPLSKYIAKFKNKLKDFPRSTVHAEIDNFSTKIIFFGKLTKMSFIVGHCGTNTRIRFKKPCCNSLNSYPDIGGPGQHEVWVGIFLFNPPTTIVHVGILYSVQNNCSSRHLGHCSGLWQRQNARNLEVAVTYIPEKTQGSQAHEQV